MTALRTDRLILRQWRDTDIAGYAALNADPEVRRWFVGTLTPEESERQMGILRAGIEQHGFGFWAVELVGSKTFIGFVGIQHVPFDPPFGPSIEVGWRLARRFWGSGYATEAASAALDHAFGPCGFEGVVAMVVPGNLPSRRVMERLGMRHAPKDDFDHPSIPDGHPFRRHALYRLAGTEWRRRHSARRE